MLSDKEIKDLLEKADTLMEIEGNDLPYLKQALECYDKIIKNAPEHPQYFSERSNVKFRLNARLNRKDLLEGATEDINKAIQLDPDRGGYYYQRGVYLWEGLEEGNSTDNPQLLKKITADYKSCLSRTPTEPNAWLDLIAINIISCNWDEAISLYGQCKQYIKDKVNQLYRSHLGCLAFIFAGDTIEEEDIEPLHDQTIRLDTSISRELHIGSFLIKIYGKEDYKEKWSKAVEIEKIFISHYDDLPLRVLMFSALEEPGKYDDFANNLQSNKRDIHSKGKNTKNKISYLFGIIRAHHWLVKGINLKKLGKYDEAIKCYDEAIRINPDDADVWKSKGITLKKLGKYDEAIKCYDEAIRINSKDAGVWYNKGMSLNKLGKYDEEIKCYDEAVRINPEYDNAWYNKGIALTDLVRYEEAIKCFDEAVRINPSAADARNGKAIALGKLGKSNEEIKAIMGNLDINAWSNKSMSPNKLGKYNKEIKAIMANLKANTWYNKGIPLYDLGKYDEAIKCYDEALRINPEYDNAWNNKGIALDDLGKHDEAIKCYDEAIRINLGHANAWSNKGNSLYALRKYDEAIKCHDEAIRINPGYANAWSNKGVILAILGKYDEAIKCYDEAIRINPGHVNARNNKHALLSKDKDIKQH